MAPTTKRVAALLLIMTAAAGGLTTSASAVLLLYEPFDYPVGENLGGFDPDGPGPGIGTPIGQTNPHTGATWYARGSGAGTSYQTLQDTVITSGSLSYPGLATSEGNSVSYGSHLGSGGLYANSIALPQSITSGSLYASFIIRIKSNVGGTNAARHAPASFVTDASPSDPLGASLASQQSTNVVPMPAAFFMRRDPVEVGATNFSPSKSSGDGIGPAATGPSAGWQHSNTAGFTESNQFGVLGGQSAPDFNNPETWQTYFVVVKYQFDAMSSTNGQNDTVSLWMNPGSGTLGFAGGEALASQAATGNLGSYFGSVGAFGTGALDVEAINSFALIPRRQGTDQSIAVDFDELRIGTTWESVTPAAASLGDHNGDGKVDAADYVVWRKNPEAFGGQQGYDDWRANFGASLGSGALSNQIVPEPTSATLLILAAAIAIRRGRGLLRQSQDLSRA